MTHTWAIHRGALGDSILLWPLLRTLSRNSRVTLAAAPSHASLAARFLGIEPANCDSRPFTLLHAPEAPAPEAPILGIDRVLSFVARAGHDAQWSRNAARLFPGAAIETINHPLDRLLALELARAHTDPIPFAPARHNPDAPIVLHVGAGSHDKRWPLDRFIALAAALPCCSLLAGEVELDRFTPDERRRFHDAHGRFLDSLDTLADALLAARVVIACDSGPAHLAAALGTPTLTLFGPTDPARWAPLGENARVLATPHPARIDTLSLDAVRAAAEQALAISSPARCPASQPRGTSDEACS